MSDQNIQNKSMASARRISHKRRGMYIYKTFGILFALALVCFLASACHGSTVPAAGGDGGISSASDSFEDSGETAVTDTETAQTETETSDAAAAVTTTEAARTTAAATAAKTTTTAAKTTAAAETTCAANGGSDSVALGQAAKPLWIHVSIDKQNVTVYDAKNRVIESFVCSTGLPGEDTPKGTFKTQLKGYSFFSQSCQEGGYYYTQFSGNYLFHSVPFDKNRDIIPVEAAKLGTEASHGCVRLSIDNAKWIYDNIPRGTKVVIE